MKEKGYVKLRDSMGKSLLILWQLLVRNAGMVMLGVPFFVSKNLHDSFQI